MPSIKKSVLPQSKSKHSPEHLKNRMNNIFNAAIALSNCLKTKCKIEQEQLKKNKYAIEMEKLMLDFRENLKNGKADINKFNNDIAKLKLKAMKEKDRYELIKCQLKNCYNESLHAMKLSFESIANHADKKSKEYKLALKYKKILETKKITAEYLNKLETDMMKIKLNKM